MTSKTPTKRYAEGTSVSISRSREEIERMLKKHKATGFLYGDQGDRAAIAFELKGRRYRMELHYPEKDTLNIGGHNQYTSHLSHTERIENAYEKEKQRLWRGLALLIRGKLEAVASEIVTIEKELGWYTVMPNNQAAGEWLEPQLEEVYRTQKMPPLIPGLVQGNRQKLLGSETIEGSWKEQE